MNVETIVVILGIILVFPICIFLEVILRGEPDNIIHNKEKQILKNLKNKTYENTSNRKVH